jgi:hypothetical protein
VIGTEPPGQAFSGKGLVEHATENHSKRDQGFSGLSVITQKQYAPRQMG